MLSTAGPMESQASGDARLLYGVDSYGYSYETEPVEKPWKKVALAVGLLAIGTVLLSLGLGFTLARDNQPDAHGRDV